MASKYPETPTHSTVEKVDAIDRVSCKSGLLMSIPTSRLVTTVLLVTMCIDGGRNAALCHCEIERQRKTFMYGKWDDFGLDNEEKEYSELQGKTATQGLLSYYGSVYILTNEGELYTMGYNYYSQLGRSTHDVTTTSFAKAAIRAHILSIACGDAHCLAMTPRQVFAFGWNYYGQVGVPGGRDVSQPTEIYDGTGSQAPQDLAAGGRHSAILTEDGQVLTFGWGDSGRTGHGSTKDIDKPTRIKSLKSKVQQIGCTEAATYFLLMDGVLLGCGYNEDSSLGLGHSKDVRVPTAIKTGGHKIQSFRCSLTLVVAITLSGEPLVWGKCSDRTVIKVPELVQALEFPRDVFARGQCRDTGGSVYPDSRQQRISELTYQLTELKQKMAPLASQLIELKLDMLHVDSTEESAAKSPPGGHPDHQETQLLDHSNLIAVHASLEAAYEVIEMKYKDLMKTFDTKKTEEESLQVDFEKLNRDFQSMQVDFTSLKATFDELGNQYAKLKDEHNDLETRYQNLQSRVKDSKRITISMAVLHYVVERIGRDWKVLSWALKVRDEVLDNIEKTCSNIPHIALASLNNWYHINQEHATKEVLVKALRDIDRNDIADIISMME